MGKTIPKQLAWGRYQSNAILGLGDDTKTILSGWSHYFFINGRFEHLVLWSNKEHCLWKGHSGQTHWTLRGNTNWITYKLNVKYNFIKYISSSTFTWAYKESVRGVWCWAKGLERLHTGTLLPLHLGSTPKVWEGYLRSNIWEVHLMWNLSHLSLTILILKRTYLWFPYCLNQLGVIQVKDLEKYWSFLSCFIYPDCYLKFIANLGSLVIQPLFDFQNKGSKGGK